MWRRRVGRMPGIAVDSMNLKQYRKEAGLSQNKLAELCDLTPYTIERGEEWGKWSEKTFTLVAKKLRSLGVKCKDTDLMVGGGGLWQR